MKFLDFLANVIRATYFDPMLHYFNSSLIVSLVKIKACISLRYHKMQKVPEHCLECIVVHCQFYGRRSQDGKAARKA